jgi:hypothetical protein
MRARAPTRLPSSSSFLVVPRRSSSLPARSSAPCRGATEPAGPRRARAARSRGLSRIPRSAAKTFEEELGSVGRARLWRWENPPHAPVTNRLETLRGGRLSCGFSFQEGAFRTQTLLTEIGLTSHGPCAVAPGCPCVRSPCTWHLGHLGYLARRTIASSFNPRSRSRSARTDSFILFFDSTDSIRFGSAFRRGLSRDRALHGRPVDRPPERQDEGERSSASGLCLSRGSV